MSEDYVEVTKKNVRAFGKRLRKGEVLRHNVGKGQAADACLGMI